jgi:hypothetical protein
MKIKTVSYSKLFSLGMYMNERVGFEAEIDDTEDELAALDIFNTSNCVYYSRILSKNRTRCFTHFG